MKANKLGYISVLNIVDINRKKIFITEKKNARKRKIIVKLQHDNIWMLKYYTVKTKRLQSTSQNMGSTRSIYAQKKSFVKLAKY